MKLAQVWPLCWGARQAVAKANGANRRSRLHTTAILTPHLCGEAVLTRRVRSLHECIGPLGDLGGAGVDGANHRES